MSTQIHRDKGEYTGAQTGVSTQVHRDRSEYTGGEAGLSAQVHRTFEFCCHSYRKHKKLDKN